jgi:hypothetical protein
MKMTLILHLNINLDGIWNSRTQYNESVRTHIVSTISKPLIKNQDNDYKFEKYGNIYYFSYKISANIKIY